MLGNLAYTTCKFAAVLWRSIFENSGVELRPDLVRSAIQQSLRQVFGAIGGALPFEVLEVRLGSAQAFLKADKA